MELTELSPALLQPQVTVVATLVELLVTLPRRDETLPVSPGCLYWGLEDFTRELRATLCRTDDTWRRNNVTNDEDNPLTFLSQALAAYDGTPRTPQYHQLWPFIRCYVSLGSVKDSWAELAKKATKLRNTCREVLSEVADMAATATTWARELQAMVAHYGTAQENMVGLGQALGREEGAQVVAGREAQVRREAMVAASEATRATMARQWVEVALGLLERLVAACDEATVFPRELQRTVREIEAALDEINEASSDVRKGLLAQVAVAKWLWEANAHLAKDHLRGTVDDITKLLFTGGRASPSACGVAERCQKTTEDIRRLLQPPECPQSVPRVSAVTMEPQKVSSPQLQVLVAVVAALGEVVARVTGPHWGKYLCKFPDSLHEDLKNFTWSLRAPLKHGSVTSMGDSDVPSLKRALATLWATPGTTWADVRAAASAWRELVAKLVDSWDWLVREATKLHEKGVTAQQLMVAQDKEEVAWAVATYDAQAVTTTKEAWVEAVAASRRGRWAVVALGPLQRLVAVCVKATLFYWNMEWQLRDIEAILKGTKEVSPDVLQAVMVKVVKFEWLWEASTRLAKEHLLGTLEDIHNLLLSPCGDHGGPGGPSSHAVAERCQRAIEDIPRLLQESFT